MNNNNILPVIICASEEWKNIKKYSKPNGGSPFETRIDSSCWNVVYFYSGCGKTNAAACTQYIISAYKTAVIINIGTCGGLKGKTELNKIYIIKSAFYYDYLQLFGKDTNDSNGKQSLHKDSLVKNISDKWLKEINVKLNLDYAIIASADSDSDRNNKHFKLAVRNNAVCFDWESTSIAKICERNKTKLLILRGISDFVEKPDERGYVNNTKEIIGKAVKIVCSISKSL